MSNIDSYGALNNNSNSGLPLKMRVGYSTDEAAGYRPLLSPESPHSASLPPPSIYQDGSDMAEVPICIDGVTIQRSKRKLWRPRKYDVDGGSSSIPPPPQLEAVFRSSGLSSPITTPPMASPSGKKSRGRPKGSKGRKQQRFVSLGSAGIGFTPHVITVKAGEDVFTKIMSFSQNGTRGVCILSANGVVSNVTFRQAATAGGTVTYEGRFEILSLSGSYMLLESGGQLSRTGGLSALLAGPDGCVLGGNVAGILTAAAPVQVVVGSFISGEADFKSPNQAVPPLNLLVPGAPAGGSPVSPGTVSEESGGSESPLNQSTRAYDNQTNHQGMNSLSWQ